MPRAGRNLETLVAHLERTLLGKDGVTVESPAFLSDKVTGQRREFDVLVSITKGHHCLRVAFEVKDQQSKIDSPLIEQFATKTSDTDVQDKLFVASSGYFSPALTKAEHHGIKCLTLQQALALPWCLATDFRCVTRRNKSPHYRLLLVDEASAAEEARSLGRSMTAKTGEPPDMAIVDADGNEIEWNHFGALAWEAISNSESIEDMEGIRESEQRLQTVDLAVESAFPVFLMWRGSTQRHPISTIRVTVPYEINVQTTPLGFHTYESTTGASIAELAQSGEFNVLGSNKKLSLVRDAAGAIRIAVHQDEDSE